MGEILSNYADLPDAVKVHLLALEDFIGDVDGKDTDEGTIDAEDAAKAFNGIVAYLRLRSVGT